MAGLIFAAAPEGRGGSGRPAERSPKRREGGACPKARTLTLTRVSVPGGPAGGRALEVGLRPRLPDPGGQGGRVLSRRRGRSSLAWGRTSEAKRTPDLQAPQEWRAVDENTPPWEREAARRKTLQEDGALKPSVHLGIQASASLQKKH